MIIEKKAFTNIYWNIKKNDLVSLGIFPSEAKAAEKRVPDDEVFVFNMTVPVTLQYEVNFEINKKPTIVEVKTVDVEGQDQ